MAKFTDQCKTYKSASDILGRDIEKNLGYETKIRRIDNKTIAIQHHKTDVVIYHRNGVIELNTAGWESKTTKERINHFSPIGVTVIGGIWWINTEPPVMFHEGAKLLVK